MKALIDVDGVVADFIGHVLDVLRSTKKPEDITDWHFLTFLSPEEQAKAHELLDTREFWETLPLKEGARDGISHLRDFLGFDITWITSPWPGCAEWADARKAWIKRHFGNDPVIIASDKEKYDGDLFIDDKPANVEKWRNSHLGKQAFLFDTPQNKSVLLPRVTWESLRCLG